MQPIGISRKRSDEKEFEKHIDPVCKMTVTAATAAARHDHEGNTYYFCMSGCRDKFVDDPERYLSVPPAVTGGSDREYTCPMHPEIVQIGPGSCPICGM